MLVAIGMKVEDMRAALRSHRHFLNEKVKHRALPNGRKGTHRIHAT